jgi:hypothetical protein
LPAFDAQHVELALDVTEDEIRAGHLAVPDRLREIEHC